VSLELLGFVFSVFGDCGTLIGENWFSMESKECASGIGSR